MKNKVFVIGLDGGTFELLDPLMDQGHLPNFKKIIDNGVRSNLRSTIPPITPSAWVSFMTGKWPDKHGVYGFVVNRTKDKSSFVTSKHIRAETVWEIINNSGLSTGIINVPITYPPGKVNGYMISGFPAPEKPHDYIYPEYIEKEITDKFGEYIIDVSTAYLQNYDEEGIKAYIDRIKYVTEKRYRVSQYLQEKYPTDFSMIVFESPDRLQHKFWKYLDHSQKNYHDDLADKYREEIVKCYAQIDNYLGEILEEIDDNTHFIIMSDHGFGPFNKNFYLNHWLAKQGYTRLKWGKLILAWIAKRLGLKDGLKNRASDYLDWKKTTAFSGNLFEQGIFINKGKDNLNYNNLREKIKKELLGLKDGDKRLVEHIFYKEEIYKNINSSDMPDILFIMKDYEYLINNNLRIKKLLAKDFLDSNNNPVGFHRLNGIFIGYGKNMKSGLKLDNAAIVDIAPTILYLMGLDIPPMDGAPLMDIFKEDFKRYNPIKRIDHNNDHKAVEENIYDLSEQEDISRQLEGLGYI